MYKEGDILKALSIREKDEGYLVVGKLYKVINKDHVIPLNSNTYPNGVKAIAGCKIDRGGRTWQKL
jgi:hypothetical protein